MPELPNPTQTGRPGYARLRRQTCRRRRGGRLGPAGSWASRTASSLTLNRRIVVPCVEYPMKSADPEVRPSSDSAIQILPGRGRSRAIRTGSIPARSMTLRTIGSDEP